MMILGDSFEEFRINWFIVRRRKDFHQPLTNQIEFRGPPSNVCLALQRLENIKHCRSQQCPPASEKISPSPSLLSKELPADDIRPMMEMESCRPSSLVLHSLPSRAAIFSSVFFTACSMAKIQ